MSPRTKYWLKFSIRWSVAVVGIGYVLWGITFRDRTTVLDPATSRPDYVQVLGDANEDQAVYRIARDVGGVKEVEDVPRDQLWAHPDRKAVDVRLESGQVERRKLLAIRPSGGKAAQFLVEDSTSKNGAVVDAADVVRSADEDMTVSLPIIEIGLIRMVREADRRYLLGAVFMLPLCHLLTSMRWHVLLRALGIRMSQARTFTINMVGAFYSAFMPGTTGGDVVKAYYAAKHTPMRTRAVISVLVDRAIGLYALVIIGGVTAAYQWDIPDCRQVAIIAGALLGMTLLGLIVFYIPVLRKYSGLNYVLKRLPMQVQVRKAVEAMEVYGRQPLMLAWAFGLAFPVHAASIFSATLAGKALGLPLSELYYWAVVPVIALVGAIPISPQGAGVMEFFAVQLTRRQGVTVSQAFALVMAIRLIQILWNLAAGLFVLRGGYHAPSEKETHDLEQDDGNAGPGTSTDLSPRHPNDPPLGSAGVQPET